jgi:hypothetical protein
VLWLGPSRWDREFADSPLEEAGFEPSVPLRADDALLRTGDNEVIAGGVESPFVFSVFVA